MAKLKTAEIKSIKDLRPDPKNANRGTARGLGLVEDSLSKYGAGRSIVTDRNGIVIGGNKTLESAAAIGLEIEVVRTTGQKLVVVQREDLDLMTDDKARKLAYADNRAGEMGLEWDAEQLKADIDAGLDLTDLFFEDELDKITDFAEMADLPDLESEPDGFKRVTFILTDAQAETVESSCSMARKFAPDVQMTGNENSNGNALEYICAHYNVSNKS